MVICNKSVYLVRYRACEVRIVVADADTLADISAVLASLDEMGTFPPLRSEVDGDVEYIEDHSTEKQPVRPPPPPPSHGTAEQSSALTVATGVSAQTSVADRLVKAKQAVSAKIEEKRREQEAKEARARCGGVV